MPIVLSSVPVVRVLNGDCREVLKTLPDGSVNCCVTSPPYFGLRDYGTAKWEGGDPACDHKQGRNGAGRADGIVDERGQRNRDGVGAMGGDCKRCGARRVDSQIGLEPTPEAYVAQMVAVFREVRRVLRDDGTLWLNLGDSYAAARGGTHQPAETLAGGKGGKMSDGATVNRGREAGYNPTRNAHAIGLKHKDLIGIPWRVAFALQADGWYLRQDIIWHKPNPMPESVTDRCTKAHEYIFLLSKSERYWFDSEAMKEPVKNATIERNLYKRTRIQNGGGSPESMKAVDKHTLDFGDMKCGLSRNRRSVWTVATKPYKGAHFATFPSTLIEPCILAGCPPAGKRCDCDDVIATPTGCGDIVDPTMHTGRAGMNRDRRENEGTRPITRRAQRHEALEMKSSPHRQEMERACGDAFAHYIRTDRSGARPLPETLRQEFKSRGWITEAPPCAHPSESPGVVLDPFGGSGTTGEVAKKHGRAAILVELNPEYLPLIHDRTNKES